MASSELDLGNEVAEPFRFNFEIAWEVANKGQTWVRKYINICHLCICAV